MSTDRGKLTESYDKCGRTLLDCVMQQALRAHDPHQLIQRELGNSEEARKLRYLAHLRMFQFQSIQSKLECSQHEDILEALNDTEDACLGDLHAAFLVFLSGKIPQEIKKIEKDPEMTFLDGNQPDPDIMLHFDQWESKMDRERRIIPAFRCPYVPKPKKG